MITKVKSKLQCPDSDEHAALRVIEDPRHDDGNGMAAMTNRPMLARVGGKFQAGTQKKRRCHNTQSGPRIRLPTKHRAAAADGAARSRASRALRPTDHGEIHKRFS